MPELGETRRAYNLNYRGRGLYLRHACEECSVERWVLIRKGLPSNRYCVSCSRKIQFRVMSSHPSWKGGRFYGHDGYVFLRIQADDPFSGMADSHNSVREHRLVMARHLGRCLNSWEIVHHKNGIKDDNRIENLELLSGRKYHIVDTIVKTEIKKLKAVVERQSKQLELQVRQIKLLQWHVKEINKQPKENKILN